MIVSYDGKKIQETASLPALVAATPVGKAVTVDVIRDGKIQSVSHGGEDEKNKEKSGTSGIDILQRHPHLNDIHGCTVSDYRKCQNPE